MSQTDGQTRLRTRGITAPIPFRIEPPEDVRREIAERLGLTSLRKLRFEGTVSPDGRRDLLLEGSVGATVVQPCVVTGDPVTTRIDAAVLRRFLEDMPAVPDADEMEMPEDETQEALPDVIDLMRVMEEALSLEVPDFPRAEGVETVDLEAVPPGAEPISDDETKPFASLSALRDKMGSDDGEAS